MKGMVYVDENMSNLTSASNEASLSSSSNKNETGTVYPPPQIQQSFASGPIYTTNSNQNQNQNQTQMNKKKRNLPGNPDPEAEVVALSPKSLMATNRFLCEVCHKGFQRDQNLQLHKRGHNLPWNLKQRSKQDVVKKKVFVCPEPSCVHHEPSRALGDLTGIKKHYSRKHGEKKWKCDKCAKRYAVQSDWKAHSKICGTREYRCDCGTLFSRKDSFITHRAFCDALAEETARSSSASLIPQTHFPFNSPFKTEPQNLLQSPSWPHNHQQPNPNPNPNHTTNNTIHLTSPHMSATALLQKAAQMGATMSKPATAIAMSQQQQQQQSILSGPHQLLDHHHMSAAPTVLLTSQHHHHHHHHASAPGSLSSSDNHHQGALGFTTAACMDQMGASATSMHANSLTCTSVGSTAFEQAYNGFQEAVFRQASAETEAVFNTGNDHAGGSDELTRDFLGLQGFPTPTDHHFLSMAGFDHINTSSPYHPNPNPNQIWQVSYGD